MTRPVALPSALLVFFLASNLAALEDLTAVKAEIQRMRDENEQLRKRLDRQDELIEALLVKIDGLVNDADNDGQHGTNGGTLPAESTSDSQEPIVQMGDSSTPPDLFVRGFADVNYVATSNRGELGPDENSFVLDEFDLLFTSQLSDELSVLSELVFHFGETDDLSFFELERLYLKYSPLDLINVKFGRTHTPLGYWNQTFHHGAWFQTTVERPEIFKFEDDGGLLPVHSAGLELSGLQGAGPLDIDYKFMIGNGRGETIDTVQNTRDLNRSKAITFRLNLAPTEIAGLQFGVTTYFDRFPATATADGPGELDELIAGGHIVYGRGRTELLAEVVGIRHRDEVRETAFDTLGLYLQGAYEIQNWKPYYRFDYLDIDEGDPIFGLQHHDIRRHTFGSRWDASTWLALKFEYAYEERPRFDSLHRFATQGAFSF